MKKSVKGAIAAAAAAALLLGGGGTLAYWNATASLGSGTITAGQLALKAEATSWTLNGKDVADVSAVRVVPGDELAFKGSFTIQAVGDNLKAKVQVADSSRSGTLLQHVKVTPTYTLKGAPVAADSTITSADNGAKLDVSLLVDFPFGTAADNASQQTTLNLNDISVTLTQEDTSP